MSDNATFGEIWLEILIKSFPSMSKEQAVPLLAKQGGLAKALAAGSDAGRNMEITAWLNAVLKARNPIGSAIERDSRKQPAVYSCMNPLFACLFTKDPNILSLAARVILALAQVIPPQVTYEVMTTAIDPENPRRPNSMLLGLLLAMEKAKEKSTRTKICRFIATICDMSSQRLRALLRTHLLNASRTTPMGPSSLHSVYVSLAEFDVDLRDLMVLDKMIDQTVIETINLCDNLVETPESRDSESSTFSPRREALISQLMSLSNLHATFGTLAPCFQDSSTQKNILHALMSQ